MPMRLCVSGYKMPRPWCRSGWIKRYTEAMKRFLAFLPALVLFPGWPAFLAAQPRPAVIKIDSDRVIGEVDPHLFGNFTEHLGRCIYGGIFEEGSPLADENGFRKDVLAAVQGLGVTILRWPGGNFASGYNWMDGIGRRAATTPGARSNRTASAPTSFSSTASAWARSRTSASMPVWDRWTRPVNGSSTATNRATHFGRSSAARTAAKSRGA